MPYEVTDLPEPENDFDARVLADIQHYGWHCLQVADENHPEHVELNAALPPHPVYDASFTYTVGLPPTLKAADQRPTSTSLGDAWLFDGDNRRHLTTRPEAG